MTSDLDLLRQFARENAQDAFGEIVRRHLNLVYSAALRQVRSPQLAEEIAQSVFADLARNAGKLAGGGDASSPQTLTPWLYAVTRRTAIDVVRKESRRRLREQIAVEMNNMDSTQNDWRQIEPLLDDAMAALEETDRSAVLLRYFENKSLREVGEALGASEDAAQKRVGRAVERLREFFSKQKITIGASGLAVLISANAVQSAPIGMAATITAAALLTGTAVSTSTAIATTNAIAMTTLQKTIVAAMLTAAVGTGVYEAHQASQMRGQVQTLQQQQATLAEQMRQLQHERDDATNRLAGLFAENEQLQSGQNETELLKLRSEVGSLRNDSQELAQLRSAITNDPAESAAKSWLNRVSNLKQRLEQMPNRKIPEMQFLTDQDWLRITSTGNFDTDADVRRALCHLREDAKEYLAPLIGKALGKYVAANAGSLPTEVSQLAAYFEPPIDDSILQRYQMLKTGDASNLSMNEMVIGERGPPVDNEYDTVFQIGLGGYRSEGVGNIHATSMGNFSASWHYDPRFDRTLDK